MRIPKKLDPQVLAGALADQNILSWIGVPDSTLEPLIQTIDQDSRLTHTIATNECEAASIAMGKFLGSGQPSVVYLQNSGFGKTIHPITSLLSNEVCGVPLLLVIGWRGEPGGAPDEPQHKKMGRVMTKILDAIELPYEILDDNPETVTLAVQKAAKSMRAHSSPYALIIRPGLLATPPKPTGAPPRAVGLARKQIIETVTELLPESTLFVSTTGKTSRELFFIREEHHTSHTRDFYTVGGMGCASSIALGIALSQPDRPVCVLDGDGAALMQMGSLATIGHLKPVNILHILVDNECYESTGGQPTISPTTDFIKIAGACGYPWVRLVHTQQHLDEALREAVQFRGLRLLVIKAAPGSDPNLGRPNETPRENTANFLKNLGLEPCKS